MGYKEFLKKIRYRLTAKLKNGYLGGGVEEMWKGVENIPNRLYSQYCGYMDHCTDNDWVYGYYNLISRILILAAINNGSGKGRRNGT